MQDRIYNGPLAEAEIPLGAPLADGTRALFVKRGDLLQNIPDEVAERLDEQGDWLLPDGSVPDAAKPREARVFTKEELAIVAKEAGIKVPRGATKEHIEDLIEQHTRDQDRAEGDGATSPAEAGDQTSGGQDESTSAPSGEKE